MIKGCEDHVTFNLGAILYQFDTRVRKVSTMLEGMKAKIGDVDGVLPTRH